jgi:hypothetical protein
VPGPVDQLVPAFLPGEPRLWTYLSGIAEIVVALMLFAPLGSKIAGKSIRLWGAYSALHSFLLCFQPISIWRSSGVHGKCRNRYLRMRDCHCSLDFFIGRGRLLKIYGLKAERHSFKKF